MNHSTALGWIDYDISGSFDWDSAQVRRLARHLGYHLVWPDGRSLLRVVDQARNAAADLVILPAPDHLSPLELNAVMDVADVETVVPRLSFARWTFVKVAP
ncbi:hypothetical protein [Nocardia jinanensis]|uniref:Uncharacterized protein n=1 Tax=Nocardia jinanensis TaxID=382504 RepID=A0A917VR50_9NOCA|nr:hypothetical protein [Nocardia jinanensis]GGL06186.1 hypothetical protein GCM10011588_20840 [Nocardia jinanensis]